MRPTPNARNNCPVASPRPHKNRALKAQGSGRAAFGPVSTLGFSGHLLLRPILGRFSVGALPAVIGGAPRGHRPTSFLYWRDLLRGSPICARSFTWGQEADFAFRRPLNRICGEGYLPRNFHMRGGAASALAAFAPPVCRTAPPPQRGAASASVPVFSPPSLSSSVPGLPGDGAP